VILSELLLEIESVTDMDLERAIAVGRAYDQDPELRPLRVGGDPARVKVEGSLEEIIRRTGLPISWLTVRTNSRRDGFEGGGIVLRPGRGGYIGWPGEGGTQTFQLVPNKVDAGFLRSWTDAEADRLDRVAALFGRLCEAIDACYGIATVLPRKRAMPPVDVGLGDVGWLNYFGPAFIERFPRLADTVAGTTRVANGGMVIRIAPTPWDLDDAAKQPVIDAIGEDAFVRAWGAGSERGVHVPSYEDHLRHSPGTMEMPWVRGEIERDAARAERTRQHRYTRARRQREAAMADRGDPGAVLPENEWSTSFDADDWRSLGRRLFKRLGGELAGPLGKALLEEIASAPLNLEESVAVTTEIGQIEVRWFIDDVDTVDIYLFGPPELPDLIDAEHERWVG
jgi:hypothetical protein